MGFTYGTETHLKIFKFIDFPSRKSIMTYLKVIKLYEIEFVHLINYPPALNTCANVIRAAMVKKIEFKKAAM